MMMVTPGRVFIETCAVLCRGLTMLEGDQPDLYQAAKTYTKCGIIVHPLYRGDEKSSRCRSPGKQPILKKWQSLDKPLEDGRLKYFFQERQCNIGAVCGKVSDLTVIDVDWEVKGIWTDIFDGVDRTGWIAQRRIDGKCHVLFRYTNKINRAIRQELGFDIMNDRSNVVLAPSIHPEGQQYRILADIADRPYMPDIVATRINSVIMLYEELAKALSGCRHMFRGLWDAVFVHKKNPWYHKLDVFREATGRTRTLALFAELKKAGASDEVLRLACQLIFGDLYSDDVSKYQISQINADATAKKETIQADPVLLEFYDPIIAKAEYKAWKAKTKPVEKPDTQTEAIIIDDLDENGIPEEKKEAAKVDAIQILQEGDPVKYILDTVSQFHTGDVATEEGLLISIAGQSCLNTAGIQIAVNGESGSGKSHAVKIHLHLVPAKYKRVTSLSAKAAYYMGLKPGTIIFSDDTSPSEDMEEVIKRATTNYQEYTTHTTVKDQRGMNFVIPPRINWYLTSVDTEVSEQLLNRQLTFNTIDTIAQKEAIYNMQQQEAMSGELNILVVNHEILVCRRIYDIIRSRMFKVKVPYAMDIELSDKSNSRTFPLFLDMIKGYAIVFHAQRETDPDGYLLANIEDFERAKRLFESQTDGIISKLNDKERLIIEFIATHPHVNINTIAKATKLSYGTVRNLIKGRSDRSSQGLLDKYKGLEISDETHTTEEESGYKVAKKSEFFHIVSGQYDYWTSFNSGFVTLRKR